MLVKPAYRKRCAEALDLALGQVAAYATWRRHDPGPGRPVMERYAAMPVLTKDDLRAYGPEGFLPPGRRIAEGIATREIELVSTSGTTSERVVNVWCQSWWDAAERASWRLNSHARLLALGPHREAILTSPRQTGFAREDGWLSMAERTRGRFLYLNERTDAGAWVPEHMDRMIAELTSFAPEVLEANPSFLARLCRHALARGTKVWQPGLVVLSYENPSPTQLRIIRRVFEAPVASSYGTTEAGYVFMQCEHGRMHQVTECCHVDVLPFAPVGLVRILATSFGNPWRALLRFDVGDLARVADRPCPCGNDEGLTLEGLEGRAVGITLASDGSIVTPAEIDRQVAEVAGVVDFRLRQAADGSFTLQFVVDPVDDGRDRGQAGELRERLQALYGPRCPIEVQEVAALAPELSGKYLRSATERPVVLPGG